MTLCENGIFLVQIGTNWKVFIRFLISFTILLSMLLLSTACNETEEKKVVILRKVITTPTMTDAALDGEQERETLLDLSDTTDRTVLATSLRSLFCEADAEQCLEKDYLNSVVTLCDETLETKLERDELRELLECRNPDFSANEIDDLLRYRIKKRRKNCINITALPKGKFKLEVNKDFLPVPQPVNVFAYGDLETSRTSSFSGDSKQYVVSRSQTIEMVTDLNTKLLIVAKGKPIGCSKYPQTNRGSTLFNVKPIDVPSEDTVNITQCYLGSYSHGSLYAIDLGMNLNDDLIAVKPGVVVKVNKGSGVHCKSYMGQLNLLRFKVYLDGQVVTSGLQPCTTGSCEYSSLPKVCWTSRAANQVVVRHADNTYSTYIHMKKENNDVKIGSVVNARDVVGQIGLSGWLTGAHLHFETQELVTDETSSSFKSFPVKFNVSDHDRPVYPCRDTNTLSPVR